MAAPRFSVVVPVHNGADYLQDALDSLAAQTYENFEVIVTDDGSADGSGEIARGHAVAPKVVRGTGDGEAVARNRGIAAASGTFVATLDHDDLYHATRMERAASWLDSHTEARALCTRLFPFVNSDDVGDLTEAALGWSRATVARGDEFQQLVTIDGGVDVQGSDDCHVRDHEDLLGWFHGGAQLVVDRDLAIAAGLYTTHARMAPDNLFLLNLSRLTEIFDVDQPTYFYRLRPGSAVRKPEVPWGRLASVVAFRLGGLHMGIDRALGRAGTLERDPQIEDLIAASARRGELLRQLPQFRHLLHLYLPNPKDRRELEWRLLRETITGRVPGAETIRRKVRERFPASRRISEGVRQP